MLRTTLLAGAVLALTAAPAFAHGCPGYAATIDGALAASNLTAAEKSEITALRDEGMALHNAGDHHESEHVLNNAMTMLLKGFSV
jgi:hypothetical protein